MQQSTDTKCNYQIKKQVLSCTYRKHVVEMIQVKKERGHLQNKECVKQFCNQFNAHPKLQHTSVSSKHNLSILCSSQTLAMSKRWPVQHFLRCDLINNLVAVFLTYFSSGH